jgi:hypothetical protein
MNNLERLPFRAMHAWRSYQKDREDPCVLAQGLWELFRQQPATVYVWSEDIAVGDQHYCDVQFEVPMAEGPNRQVYVMTLITDQHAREQEAMAQDFEGIDLIDAGLPIDLLEDPFTMPTVRWDVPLTRKEVLSAVRAWATKFWPDWEVTLVWGEVTPLDHLWEGVDIRGMEPQALTDITHCDVLLQVEEGLLYEVKRWAEQRKIHTHCVGESLIALIKCSREHLEDLEEVWPSFEYIAVPTPLIHQS